MKRVLVSAMIFATLAAPVHANDGTAFRAEGVDQACITGTRGDICRHYFGGDTIKIAVASASCKAATAELLQVSTRLEAPVPDAVTPFDAAGICAGKGLAVTLPAVTHETEFEVVVRGSDEGQIYTLPLMAYPRGLLDVVKSWAEYRDNALIVQEKDGKLGDVLERAGVAFTARDTAAATANKLRIIVGKDDGAEVKGDYMRLEEETGMFPLVTITRTAGHVSADIRAKLLDAMTADDPLAQKTFAEIFREIAK